MRRHLECACTENREQPFLGHAQDRGVAGCQIRPFPVDGIARLVTVFQQLIIVRQRSRRHAKLGRQSVGSADVNRLGPPMIDDFRHRMVLRTQPGLLLCQFFDRLGPDRCAQITHVSADGAGYIVEEVTDRCAHAVLGIDPFHVVKWTNDALAAVRIDAWKQARALARYDPPALSGWARRNQWLPGRDLARGLKGARFALAKNPENLTERQQAKLKWIATADPRLYRAYLLKEALRLIFQMPPDQAADELDRWLAWARRSRIDAFVDLARKIGTYRDRILISIQHSLSNGLIEGVNTKIRLLTRLAFGFHNANALIALAMLSLGRHRPALPNRT